MLNVGDSLGTFTIDSVSAERMKAMAVLLEDPNPIHLDEQATRSLGLGDRVVNQGPANLAYVLNLLLRELPSARVSSIETRYVGTVLAADAVAAGGTVEVVKEGAGGETILEVEVWLDVVGGRRALAGRAELLLPPGD